MLEKVKRALRAGRKVKVFTARAGDPRQIPLIQQWTVKHGLGKLEVTNEKDENCEEIWDDRAKSVVPNKGRFAN